MAGTVLGLSQGALGWIRKPNSAWLNVMGDLLANIPGALWKSRFHVSDYWALSLRFPWLCPPLCFHIVLMLAFLQ